MLLSRRSMLKTSAGIAALGVAACANGSFTLTPAQVVTDLGNGAAMLLADLPIIGQDLGPKLLPATLLAQLESDAQLAVTTSKTLSTSMTASQSLTGVQQVVGYFNDVLNTLAAPPINGVIPAPFNLAVQALDVIVTQIIEPWIAQITGTAAAPAPFVRASLAKAKPGMTPAEAEAILAGIKSGLK
jgi:hypothetical protein